MSTPAPASVDVRGEDPRNESNGNGRREIAIREVSRPALEVVALLRTLQATPPLPLFLDLKAAATYSGLPQSCLRELIRDKKRKAVKRGGWRISRLALEKLAS
jgi:hypothetical protein